MGGSAAASLYKAGLILISGENSVISTMKVPKDYSVIIGIPGDYIVRDSRVLLKLEIKNMHKFIQTGRKFGPIIAYNILHKMLPAIQDVDMKTIGDIIYDYRFNMGSIVNCSYAYPKLVKLMTSLKSLKKLGYVDVLSISSVGPGVFVITRNNKDECVRTFRKLGLKTFTTKIHNTGFRVLEKKVVAKP